MLSLQMLPSILLLLRMFFVFIWCSLIYNVLQLQEVGDFETLNCLPVRNEVKAGLPPLNCLWNTKPRLLGRCCYAFVVLFCRPLFCPRAFGQAYSFGSFGLCVGLCDLAMCMTAKRWLYFGCFLSLRCFLFV